MFHDFPTNCCTLIFFFAKKFLLWNKRASCPVCCGVHSKFDEFFRGSSCESLKWHETPSSTQITQSGVQVKTNPFLPFGSAPALLLCWLLTPLYTCKQFFSSFHPTCKYSCYHGNNDKQPIVAIQQIYLRCASSVVQSLISKTKLEGTASRTVHDFPSVCSRRSMAPVANDVAVFISSFACTSKSLTERI